MDLGLGEYLVISNCMKIPYNKNSIADLVNFFSKQAFIFDIELFSIKKEENIFYNKVLDGIEIIQKTEFVYEDLLKYPLESLYIKLKNGLLFRIYVSFIDETTYEVALITNYTQNIEEISNMQKKKEISKYIEKIAETAFFYLSPIYANIGIEYNVKTIEELRLTENILSDRVYISRKILDTDINFLKKKSKYFYETKEGIYLRNSQIHEYYLYENMINIKINTKNI